MFTRLCLNYEAKGGGYLKAKDTRGDIHTVLPAVPYTKTASSRQVCYRYDDAPPEHCSVSGTCSSEPLHLDHRISRVPIHIVRFTGWTDPVPTGGTPVTSSKIESYEIRVNEVLPSKGIQKVDYISNFMAVMVDDTVTEMTLNLTSDKPRLYCLTLEVKDVSENVRQSRRFILIDEITFIETHTHRPFQFTSASQETGYTWQTHHNDICLSWKEYFVNKFYLENELFNGVEADPQGLITEKYEQINGELPVSGTPNVHGIVKYMVSWAVNNGTFTSEIAVPDFLNQTFCKHLLLTDGEQYTFNVRAVDIVGNTLNDSRTVFIDGSPPLLSELCVRNAKQGVQCKSSISDMDSLLLEFRSFDYHSGIIHLHWFFGKHGVINDSKTSEIRHGEFKLVNIHSFYILLETSKQ